MCMTGRHYHGDARSGWGGWRRHSGTRCGTSRKRRWTRRGNTGAVCDERGNLLAVTDPLQQNTWYQHDRHGQVVQITDARGE